MPLGNDITLVESNDKSNARLNGVSLNCAAMTLGQRIEERRQVVGISQSELARRVGVRQSTINSLIKGDSRTSRSLLKIARELRTTPEYLTGETDDPEAGTPDEVPLDYYQRDLLECVAMMTPADRKALLQLARSLAGIADPKNFSGFSETVHAPPQDYRGED